MTSFKQLLVYFHYTDNDVLFVFGRRAHILYCIVKAVSVDVDWTMEACDLLLWQPVLGKTLIVKAVAEGSRFRIWNLRAFIEALAKFFDDAGLRCLTISLLHFVHTMLASACCGKLSRPNLFCLKQCIEPLLESFTRQANWLLTIFEAILADEATDNFLQLHFIVILDNDVACGSFDVRAGNTWPGLVR